MTGFKELFDKAKESPAYWQQKNELLREELDGLRAGILDLAKLCGCEEEPRFKWIRLHITSLQNDNAELKKTLSELMVEYEIPASDYLKKILAE